MGANNMAEILELVKTAQTKAIDDLTKNFVQPNSSTNGLQGYDLTGPSKKLYPMMTPIRNTTPRVGGGFAVQANWKAIVGINNVNQRIAVSEGNRGGAITHKLDNYLAAYVGYGLEKNVSFEADYSAQGFEDVKALAVQQTLEATMIGEEMVMLGGNGSQAMGTTPTPTLVGQTTGGTLPAATYSCICVALGLQAYWDVAGANNGNSNQSLNIATATIAASITRTNADASVDTFGGGVAQKSAAASVVTTGSTSSVQATVAVVRNAVAYAWFVGVAGSERLIAITTTNSAVFTAPGPGGAQLASTLPASDNSTNALEFDGLLTIGARASLNGYYNALATGTPGVGTGLTVASGRIPEIDAALADRYDKYRLQPDEIHMNFRQFQRITNLVLGSTNPNVQFTVDPNSVYEMIAGRNVGKYVSPITGQIISLVVHPNMPPGTMLFRTTKTPAYIDGVSDICRMRMRREYYQIEWPLRTRRYEYGVYADGVLQHFFPPSLGILTNIAN
jgi:hypothetical protein